MPLKLNENTALMCSKQRVKGNVYLFAAGHGVPEKKKNSFVGIIDSSRLPMTECCQVNSKFPLYLLRGPFEIN